MPQLLQATLHQTSLANFSTDVTTSDASHPHPPLPADHLNSFYNIKNIATQLVKSRTVLYTPHSVIQSLLAFFSDDINIWNSQRSFRYILPSFCIFPYVSGQCIDLKSCTGRQTVGTGFIFCTMIIPESVWYIPSYLLDLNFYDPIFAWFWSDYCAKFLAMTTKFL